MGGCSTMKFTSGFEHFYALGCCFTNIVKQNHTLRHMANQYFKYEMTWASLSFVGPHGCSSWPCLNQTRIPAGFLRACRKHRQQRPHFKFCDMCQVLPDVESLVWQKQWSLYFMTSPGNRPPKMTRLESHRGVSLVNPRRILFSLKSLVFDPLKMTLDSHSGHLESLSRVISGGSNWIGIHWLESLSRVVLGGSNWIGIHLARVVLGGCRSICLESLSIFRQW